MIHGSRKNRVRAVAVLSLALIAGLSVVRFTAAQQQKATTLTVGVQPQLLLVQQGSNVILKIRLAHGVTAELWADNSCDTPRNNAMTFSASGTYTIPVQSIKGHGEQYACVLSSDGQQRATRCPARYHAQHSNDGNIFSKSFSVQSIADVYSFRQYLRRRLRNANWHNQFPRWR